MVDIQKELKGKPILVYDLECATPTGKPNPEKDILRVFGAYSYLFDKYYVLLKKEQMRKLITSHKFFVGFNSMSYDNVVLHNNGFDDVINKQDRYGMTTARFEKCYDIDLMRILHPKHQNRAVAMKIKKGNLGNLLMRFDLDYVTKTLGLADNDDGKIKDFDYDILNKSPNEWTKKEVQDIKFYTRRDIELTKKLYEWMENYFWSFLAYLNKQDIYGKKYLTTPVAVYAYKAICNLLGWKEQYAEIKEKPKKYGGGYVAYPAGERFEGNIYCKDYSSLYPHIFMQCNLFSPVVSENEDGWSGDGFFSVDGKYKNKKMGDIEKLLKRLYDERLELKKKKDPREYSIKIILNSCFSKDTEIITENGIKNIKDCEIGEMVYTINQQTQELELKPIVDTQRFRYKGDMLHFHNKSFDFLVTPDHKMIRKMGNSKFKYVEANKLFSIRNGQLPKISSCTFNKKTKFSFKDFVNEDDIITVKLRNPYSQRKNKNLIYRPTLRMHRFKEYVDYSLDGKFFIQGRMRDMLIPFEEITEEKLESLFYLFGIYIAEGISYEIKDKMYDNGNHRGVSHTMSIHQYKKSNPEIYHKIESALKDIGFRYSKDEKQFKFSSTFLYRIFRQFKTSEKDVHIPDWIFQYDNRFLEKLHEGMYDGDGNKNINRYSTISEQLSHDYVKLSLMLGYKPRRTIEIMNNGRYIYRLSRRKRGEYSRAKYEKIPYDDDVFCVTVQDNHNVVVGRNGNFNFCGQCYGASGNPAFKHLYSRTTASDCTRLGRQWVVLARKKYREKGYGIIAGDTDSVYIQDPYNDEKRMNNVEREIVNEIKKYVPFPIDTFEMSTDDEITHMFFFKGNSSTSKDDFMDEDDYINKPKGFLKKNYIYIAKVFDDDGNWVDSKVVVKNLGMMKKSTSELSRKIFWEYLVPKIKTEKKVKFPKSYFRNLIQRLLEEDLYLATKRYSVNPFESYKNPSQIQAQIAKKYGPGIHFLICNNNYGVGKDKKYCKVDEFMEKGLGISHIELSNVWSELGYFIEEEKTVSLMDF